ncbi:hypothetical protein CEXT_269251 [Caerostris extrusa]|uniref:Uncharacterized protein n=1 Tax=Caerostris extrusa TaxID=172846 RepID=A0AAV4MYF8_CAEEX|nr:hypothetical protein CEXT_269251 [Caerostris extrusa]
MRKNEAWEFTSLQKEPLIGNMLVLLQIFSQSHCKKLPGGLWTVAGQVFDRNIEPKASMLRCLETEKVVIKLYYLQIKRTDLIL